MTKAEVAAIVTDAKQLVAAHERRSPTSQNATLGEKEALFNLYVRLRGHYKVDVPLEHV